MSTTIASYIKQEHSWLLPLDTGTESFFDDLLLAFDKKLAGLPPELANNNTYYLKPNLTSTTLPLSLASMEQDVNKIVDPVNRQRRQSAHQFLHWPSTCLRTKFKTIKSTLLLQQQLNKDGLAPSQPSFAFRSSLETSPQTNNKQRSIMRISQQNRGTGNEHPPVEHSSCAWQPASHAYTKTNDNTRHSSLASPEEAVTLPPQHDRIQQKCPLYEYSVQSLIITQYPLPPLKYSSLFDTPPSTLSTTTISTSTSQHYHGSSLHAEETDNHSHRSTESDLPPTKSAWTRTAHGFAHWFSCHPLCAIKV
ncbi:hypothetical protein BC941DRAFT_464131 [Chlamydoabsidia padenii]|nr:hypothetical protein BC941DRAFT_464131 [Chlamydoabsidia padenii]